MGQAPFLGTRLSIGTRVRGALEMDKTTATSSIEHVYIYWEL